MPKLLPYLFFPQKKSYSYTLSKDSIIKKMEIIFLKRGKLLSDPDFRGYFTSDNDFVMSVNSGSVTPGMIQFRSALYGKITEVKSGGEDAGEFLKTIDCYVMGSRTYEHALELSKD